MDCSPLGSSVHGILQARILEWIAMPSSMEYHSAIKNETKPICSKWMQLEIIILSEVSQKEKDRYHMISLICGI